MAQQVLQRERFGAVALRTSASQPRQASLSIDALQIQQAAAAAAAAQQYPAPALYLVATPIGNLADITLRAVHVLGLVDAVACEDSRVTGALLHHLALHKPLLALHQHNEREAAAAVLQRLRAGQRVAYASDAGTPAVSDPGAALVQAVAAAGYRVVPIPGASSVVAALSVAGDAAAHGLPLLRLCAAKGTGAPACTRRRLRRRRHPGVARGAASHRLVGRCLGSACRHAARHRVPRTDQAVRDRGHAARRRTPRLAGGRRATHARRVRAGAARHGAAAAAKLRPTPTGERVLDVLLAELPLKQAVSLAARISGAPRNALYEQALRMRGLATATRPERPARPAAR